MESNELDAAGSTLPASAGRLIGRAAELALIREQLTTGGVRLLTICGMGGIGKTRLALEAARAAQSYFTHGTRFVELAPFREPALVLSAIQAAVHLGQRSGSRPAIDALKRSLNKLHLLLVLDNFEQVLEAAPMVAELLAACPRLTVLATSRAPLHLSWERELTLGPLRVPSAELERRPQELLECPSVALLIERMAGSGLRAARAPADLAALAGICRRLDGIPLAIELAAARTRVLAPLALLARLERPLEVLTGGPRDHPERHQALRKTFDWSYQLLTDVDQQLFRHLGVFVGGCSFEAAARVCNVPMDDIGFVDALARLMDSGLVSRTDWTAAPEPRLYLLEPVREYALEQLQARGEQAAVLERHAATYLQLAESAEPHLQGHQQHEWLARLEREHGNILVALRWFADHGEVERGLRMASALCMFWWVRGFTREGLERLRDVLVLPEAEPATPSIVTARARALAAAGALMFWQGDLDGAEESENRALELFADGGDPNRRAFATISLGNCAVARRDVPRAELLYSQSRDLYRTGGDRRGAAQAGANLGLAAFYRGDFEEALALLTENVPKVQATGDDRGAAFGFRYLAMTHCRRGDFDAAQTWVRESLSTWRHARGRILLPFLLETAALVAAARGDHARALRVAAAAAVQRDETDTAPPPSWATELKWWLDQSRAALDQEASAQAWSQGRGLDLDEALAAAVALDDSVSNGAESPPLNLSAAALEPSRNGLTRRETEVLQLVAAGCTNKEIATQLRLSVATVERHLVNVYTKIGARGRTEATAFAITRGLVVRS